MSVHLIRLFALKVCHHFIHDGQNLGTEEFPRIRIGIGKPEEKENLINYVIKKMPKEEKEKLDKSIETASEGTIKIIEKGIDIAMNEFNGRNI